MNDEHAVRWALRKVRNELDYTRWHFTIDGNLTLCKVPININGIWMPEVELVEHVDCKRCLNRIKILD